MCAAVESQEWKQMELFMLTHAHSALKVRRSRGIAWFLGASDQNDRP